MSRRSMPDAHRHADELSRPSLWCYATERLIAASRSARSLSRASSINWRSTLRIGQLIGQHADAHPVLGLGDRARHGLAGDARLFVQLLGNLHQAHTTPRLQTYTERIIIHRMDATQTEELSRLATWINTIGTKISNGGFWKLPHAFPLFCRPFRPPFLASARPMPPPHVLEAEENRLEVAPNPWSSTGLSLPGNRVDLTSLAASRGRT